MDSHSKFASLLALIGITTLALLQSGGVWRHELPAATSSMLDSFAREELVTRLDEFVPSTPAVAHPIAAVLPHHLVARELIAELVVSLREAKPETIVVVGPDHKNIGPAYITTAQSDWTSGGQRFVTNGNVVRALDELEAVALSDAVIADEHSVLTPLPFLAAQFPRARFVLLTFRGKFEIDTITRVTNILNEQLGPNDLVVASVDFSHYLPLEQAEEEDARSRTALLSNDVANLKDIPADSPASLALAMGFARARGAAPTIVAHNNSAVIQDDLHSPSTTSYFTVVFHR